VLSRVFLILTLLAAGAELPPKSTGFVIDETRPYVYIRFDHAARRKPLSRDEVPEGLWLRLVNNCSIPLSVSTFDPGTGDQGVGVFDEVIASSVGGGYLDASGEFHGGPSHERPPKGYSFDVSSSTIVAPGEALLFSVPRNHVSQNWHLRVQFELEPAKKGLGPQPYSFVDFTWTMIPETDRAR
jgi:hypothetical protein